MAPVVWGLDLAEIQWAKLKSKSMWSRQYHLRRTKFIVYQIAIAFCVASETLGTAAMSGYINQRKFVERNSPDLTFEIDDYIGVASSNIFASVFVAFIFGSAFFFDLFWPMRKESVAIRRAWKTCAVFVATLYLISAVALTMVTITHAVRIRDSRGVTRETLAVRFKNYSIPLKYRQNHRAVAAVVLAWLGWTSVVASSVLLFMSIHNLETGPGPLSSHARRNRGQPLTADDVEPAGTGVDEAGQKLKHADSHHQSPSQAATEDERPVAGTRSERQERIRPLSPEYPSARFGLDGTGAASVDADAQSEATDRTTFSELATGQARQHPRDRVHGTHSLATRSLAALTSTMAYSDRQSR